MDKFSAEDLFKSALEREATAHEYVTDTLIEHVGFSAERAEAISREAALSFQTWLKAIMVNFEKEFPDLCERNMAFALFAATVLEWAKDAEPFAIFAVKLAKWHNDLGGNDA